jgi:hypothetical protein
MEICGFPCFDGRPTLWHPDKEQLMMVSPQTIRSFGCSAFFFKTLVASSDMFFPSGWCGSQVQKLFCASTTAFLPSDL